MPGAQKVIKQYGALSFGQNECAGFPVGTRAPSSSLRYEILSDRYDSILTFIN